MARPTKLDDQVRKKLIAAIRSGATLKVAAAFAGISIASFDRYRKRDAALKAEYEQATATAQVAFVNVIRKAAEAGDWRAALAWLERRCSEEWALKQVLEVAGKDGGPIQTSRAIDYASMSTPDLLALRDILRRQKEKAVTNGHGS
jgi:hypothetical protein